MKSKKKNISGVQAKKSADKSYPSSDFLQKGRTKNAYSAIPILNELKPSYSVSSRIRTIGNSKGVILPTRVIEKAGISPDADLIIQVSGSVILIAEATTGNVNTDLSSWGEQFKKSIKMGNKPEADVWDGVQNRFDEEEWS